MLTPQIEALLRAVEAKKPRFESGQDSSLEINRLTAKVATWYEKVRYLLDYKEDHTIRRSAIERILKRKFLIQGQHEETAEDFLKELVNSQYIPESAFNQVHIEAVGEIWGRYHAIIDNNPLSYTEKMMIMSFAASEIDNYFDDQSLDDLFVETFFALVKDRIFPNVVYDSQNLVEQIYCASHRAILRSDDAMLSFGLWKKYFVAYGGTAQALQGQVSVILNRINRVVNTDAQWVIAQKLRNETIYFLTIKGIVEHFRAESRQIFSSPESLDRHIALFLDYKYKRENVRIQQSGIRAVMYLFLTKILVAAAIEVPYELFFVYGALSSIPPIPILTNVLFHPFLLFVLTRGVGKLDSKNTNLIISGVHSFVDKETTTPIKVKVGTVFSVLSVIVTTLYWILIAFVFGVIISVLRAAEFSVAGIVLFIFFLALASYFAYRIRFNAQRWKVVGQESIPRMLTSMAIVPVIHAGQWLSQKFAAVNVLVMFMDLVIETPFKLILNVSDAFVTYVKEKSQEIY